MRALFTLWPNVSQYIKMQFPAFIKPIVFAIFGTYVAKRQVPTSKFQ
jgi:hypothetical protein